MCKYIYISFISICGFIFFCFKKINNGEIEKLEEELAYFKERVKNAESRLTTNQRDYKKNMFQKFQDLAQLEG